MFDRRPEEKYSAPNDSKHFLKLIFSLFQHAFWLSGFFPNICLFPPFRRIYYLSLWSNFIQQVFLQTWTYASLSRHFLLN